MRLHTTTGLALALAVAAFGTPTFAQVQGPTDTACTNVSVSLEAAKTRPGMFLGTLSGDLAGAVSLFTLKATEDPQGRVIESVVELTFVEMNSRNTRFSAMFTIREGAGGGVRPYWGDGEIVDGSGTYAGAQGKLRVKGELVKRGSELSAKLEGTICPK